MARRAQYLPLHVLMNNRLVGFLNKYPNNAIEFRYDSSWLDRPNSFPVSLSLPLRDDAYKGEAVSAVFDNLLPDSPHLRRLVAEKTGARSADTYGLLQAIGRDCVGALQFIEEGTESDFTQYIEGKAVDNAQIEAILNNLALAPLGLDRDRDFRISVAGAQEKTALLRYQERWFKPFGITPTTHIFKTQIGTLPNGIDLTNSVENEFYCLNLFKAFGLPVANVEMQVFGTTKALVIERFDRVWRNRPSGAGQVSEGDRLLRLPQEDFCQALSCPPSRKYQTDGGPGIEHVLNLLKASDEPHNDQKQFLISQILFWMIGATDGHAKNFSIFMLPGGGFKLTPFYDILTVLPNLAQNEIDRRQMKLAMSVGQNKHYLCHEIQPRHFMQSAIKTGVSKMIMRDAFDYIMTHCETAFEDIVTVLPDDFPFSLHRLVKAFALEKLKLIEQYSKTL
ncbi:type II toxin-antitoxin system HipA family toxin [Brucellaceae bacterium C25G]